MTRRRELPSLVAADWLRRHSAEADLRILDASWHLPGSGRDARAEFRAGHVPGATFLDIDRVADPASPLPHMLPSADRFAAEVRALGIDNHSRVVIYDSHGLFGAARGWWMFRVFGHDRVAILDGGLPAWQALGGSLEQGEAQAAGAETFSVRLQADRVRSLRQVWSNLEDPAEQLVDARPEGRFRGTEPEPWSGLRAGHIPGAVNVPFDSLIDPETRRLQSPTVLRQRFGRLDKRPVVCSCGTGVTACALAFGLHRIGRDDVAVYDGSWTEWAGRDDTPAETGPTPAIK